MKKKGYEEKKQSPQERILAAFTRGGRLTVITAIQYGTTELRKVVSRLNEYARAADLGYYIKSEPVQGANHHVYYLVYLHPEIPPTRPRHPSAEQIEAGRALQGQLGF